MGRRRQILPILCRQGSADLARAEFYHRRNLAQSAAIYLGD
jgi:hypothetical protein